VNQIVILIIFIVIIDEVSKMVFASRSSVAVVFDFGLIVFAAKLERGFAGFDDLLIGGHVGFGVLFFDLLLIFLLIMLTDGSFVRRVIQQIDCKRF
jgi:hypothetical protein